MSLIKTPEQVAAMREAGKLLAEVLLQLHKKIVPGLDIWKLEEHFIDFCAKNKVAPACKGYEAGGHLPPFPTGLCVSINSQSVHCFPMRGVILNEGDVITVDTVIKHKGVHVDSSFGKVVGAAANKNQQLVNTSREALKKVVAEVKPDVKTGFLSHTMERFVLSQGFNVLRDYAGHGIGEDMHESPEIACFGDPSTGMKLRPGMTICIEALVCEGDPRVDSVSEWETKMHDGKNFVQFEYTVLVTKDGHEVLTPFEV